MKVNAWLTKAEAQLKAANISTARLDCLVLLEDATKHHRAHLLAHPSIELTTAQASKLRKQLAERTQHIPLAYIRGKTEFYGRDFYINKHVLEPRPESETMIDLLLKLPQSKHIIDVGTGSGALAVTAKWECPQPTVTGVDIDTKCLAVARRNAREHGQMVAFYKSDFLKSVVLKPSTILLCNLPYVPDRFTLNQAAMNEPRIAIFGGSDGLNHYRTLFGQIQTATHKPTHILTESLPTQHADLAHIAQAASYQQTQEDDFIQVFEPK